MRRTRGYAPLPIHIPNTINAPILATGAQLKNTIALGFNNSIFVSQHLGDLETAESQKEFEKTIIDFQKLYNLVPRRILHDKHPNYSSTAFAIKNSDVPSSAIQHHVAHVASCMAENEITDSVLGFSWDGTGYGDDGSVWGGETFLIGNNLYKRVSTISPFKLIGGDSAAREPRRCAAALLYEIYGDNIFTSHSELKRQFTSEEIKIFIDMLNKNINTTVTTSIGRMFDGITSLLCLRAKNSYEGQAAMELEFAALRYVTDEYYTVETEIKNGVRIWNWKEMIAKIISDFYEKESVNKIARKFHNTLVQYILTVAGNSNQKKIVFTGGCFQNTLLLENAVFALQSNGFSPYWHQRIPRMTAEYRSDKFIHNLF